ncbi:MAG: BON domain-containing protein [Bacillota bacterium]
MRRLVTAITVSLVLMNLGGCVLAVGNGDGGDDSYWTSSESRDSSLARAVRHGLEADPATHDADISVAAEHGRVYLSGTVSSPDTLQKAVQIAFSNPDVNSVRCKITVIR